ncbi:MAG: spore coat protein [Bacilli bacterium]|nr:spore coat protein [Bacilli bacterium]
MSDQILMNSYLLLLKSTVEVYVHGTLESSNDDVRILLNDCLNSTIEMQGNTYLEMADYGFYEIKNVSDKEISKVIDKVDCKN